MLLKPVATLLNWSSAVMVTLVVLPAESVLGAADTTSLLAAAGVTVTVFDVPAVTVPTDVSLTVMVCVPATSRLTVTLPPPKDKLLNDMPPTESLKLTLSAKPDTTLLNWSSAVNVTLVVLPAERVLGAADTTSLLAAAGVTVTALLVPAVTEPTDVSLAVMVCVLAVSSVAVTVALPPLNETAANSCRPSCRRARPCC